MKIEELHIGQKVREKNHKREMIVIQLSVVDMEMNCPVVYCDFNGNLDYAFMYRPEDLEEVK